MVNAHPLDRRARHTIMPHKLLIVAVAMMVLAEGAGLGAQLTSSRPHPDVGLFFLATAQDDEEGDAALEEIAAGWRDGYAGMVWDLIRFMEPPPAPRPLEFRDPTNRVPFDSVERESPSTRVWGRLMKFLEDQTGERFRNDILRVQKWSPERRRRLDWTKSTGEGCVSTGSRPWNTQRCQWQPKTAHFWQLKTAHVGERAVGRSGRSPVDAHRACWAGRRERRDRSPGQHAPRRCGAGGHDATPSRRSSDAVRSQC